jgi:hypothetical protein
MKAEEGRQNIIANANFQKSGTTCQLRVLCRLRAHLPMTAVLSTAAKNEQEMIF